MTDSLKPSRGSTASRPQRVGCSKVMPPRPPFCRRSVQGGSTPTLQLAGSHARPTWDEGSPLLSALECRHDLLCPRYSALELSLS